MLPGLEQAAMPTDCAPVARGWQLLLTTLAILSLGGCSLVLPLGSSTRSETRTQAETAEALGWTGVNQTATQAWTWMPRWGMPAAAPTTVARFPIPSASTRSRSEPTTPPRARPGSACSPRPIRGVPVGAWPPRARRIRGCQHRKWTRRVRGWDTRLFGPAVIVWGGYDGSAVLGSGARHDPTADVWLPMSTIGAPDGRMAHTAVWTGTEMIVWGGYRISSGELRGASTGAA